MSSLSIQNNVSLSQFSTFGVGGRTDYYAPISTKIDLFQAYQFAKNKNIPILCIGGGSNMIFSDAGFRGMVFHFKNNRIRWNSFYYSLQKNTFLANNGNESSQEIKEHNYCSIESGCLMNSVYRFFKKHNLDFALLSTIPGTIGGAIAGNAGLLGIEMKNIVKKVEVFNTETEKFEWHDSDFFAFEYRKSIFHSAKIKKKYIIWEAEIELPALPESEIEEKLKSYTSIRKEKQPWGKTCGSFFKNPEEGSAGMFLEKAGLKGYKKGGAFLSEKHANFMMNDGSATQANVIELAKESIQKVHSHFGVDLKNEVKLIDEWGKEITI